MYSPPYAIQSDLKENLRVLEKYSFATASYVHEGLPQCLHLPLFLEGEGFLIGHMARANSAWAQMDQKNCLFVFQGPHHYISPTFYGTEGNVPTWNYIVVHVRGRVTIREDKDFLLKALSTLSRKKDPVFDIEANIRSHEPLLRGIVGIEIQIEDIRGKFKLAQSKGSAEWLHVIGALEALNTDLAHETAQEMRKTLTPR